MLDARLVSWGSASGLALLRDSDLCDHGLVAPEAAPWLRPYHVISTTSAVAVEALLMTIAGRAAQPGNTGNSGIAVYSRIQLYIRCYTANTAIQRSSPERSSPESGPSWTYPIRARARARVILCAYA